MEPAQAESSLKVAKVCREQCYLDSAASRAYFAMFEAVVCALEAYGVHRAEWSHKALHAAVAGVLIRRRKVVPAVLVGALPSAMEIRHTADYRQPAPSERQVRRVMLTAEQFMAAIT